MSVIARNEVTKQFVNMIQQFDLLIDGKILPASAGRYFDHINPSNNDVMARVADAGMEDVRLAVEAARKAFDHGAWPRLSLEERGQYLKRIAQLIRDNAKELADLECLSVGKTIKHATFIDVPTAAETFDYFSEACECLRTNSVPVVSPHLTVKHRQAVGVVVSIIPWNYPLIMAAWKIAPALLAGNTVILKPSPMGAVSVLALAKIIAQANLPAGVLNILTTSQSDVASALVAHEKVDMISFTGGTESGKRVMASAAQTVKKLTLELGGKSPTIVFADCDTDAAIGGSLSAVFMNQGQMCTAGSRLLVEDKIYDDFVARFIARAKTLKIGPADDFQTEFGPLANSRQRDEVLTHIRCAQEQGATLACGGVIPQGFQGAYLEPTVFVDVNNAMAIAQEEVFGPVVCIIKFSGQEQAIAIANDSKYGLAASIWSRDLSKAQHVAAQLQCGTVWINTYGSFDDRVPFGGVKQSGFGRELGVEGLLEYTQVKSIVTDQTPGGKSLVTSWF